MCFVCSKEPSHRDGSFEYPPHMFWLRNKKNNFQLRTLTWGPVARFHFWFQDPCHCKCLLSPFYFTNLNDFCPLLLKANCEMVKKLKHDFFGLLNISCLIKTSYH